MVDLNIKRFCELVDAINTKNKKLDESKKNFYEGGTSFEEVYKDDINELEKLQIDFRTLLKFVLQ
jgi:hypothetical protein